MQCPSCGATVAVEGVFPGGSVHCACGASVVVTLTTGDTARASAEVVAPKEPAPACPHCRVALVVRDEGGVVVAACAQNHGLFVTARALEQLGRTTDLGAPPSEPSAAPVTCPRCAEPMNVRTFGGAESSILVDQCPAHGVWFDAGELAAAARARVTAPPPTKPSATNDALMKQATATLDVALALEQSRDENDFRRAVTVAEDVVEGFNFFVLGRTRSYGRWRQR